MDKSEEIKIYYNEATKRFGDYEIDSVTWNDLEMDEVFGTLNHSESEWRTIICRPLFFTRMLLKYQMDFFIIY